MGRQIALILSKQKEIDFINFIKTQGEIVFITPLSKNKKINFIFDLPDVESNRWTYYIWNKKFPLGKMEFIKLKNPTSLGENFSFWTSGQPLIEYWRSNGLDRPGRIYWEKDFVQANLLYDIYLFENWYNLIIKWIKKNCKYERGVYIG